MNDFIQNNLIAIIIFLLLFIFILMGIMIAVLFRLLAYKKQEGTLPKEGLAESRSEKKESWKNENIASVTKDSIKHAIDDIVVEKFFCLNHNDEPSTGSCLICEDVFCAHCLLAYDSLHFCKEHWGVFSSFHWRQITDEKTTPNSPENGLYIYKFKRDIWLNKNIPSFVLTHYKINIEDDCIESFIQLNVREQDAENLAGEIQSFKKNLKNNSANAEL